MNAQADTEPPHARFSEEAWVDLLKSVDQTYCELVNHQVELEHRNAEHEGMRSFLVSILATMTDVLIVCGPEGQILEVDKAFLDVTGHRKEDVLGAQMVEGFAEPEREPMRRALTVLASGRPVKHAERLLLTAFEPVPLEFSATARRDGRGRYVGAVLIGRPVGEQLPRIC